MPRPAEGSVDEDPTDQGTANGDGRESRPDGDGVDPVEQAKSPSVLVVDESIRAELFELWLDGFPVRTATSRRELMEAFDPTVAVTVVRNELSERIKSRVGSLIASKSPFCRTVVTTTEHVEIMFPGIEYDVCLSEPTNRSALRETVGRLFLRAQYDSNLRVFYECSVSAANREVLLDAEDLGDDDRYQRLTERMETIRKRLDAIVDRFDADDIDAVQQMIRPEVTFGTTNARRNKRVGEKYRPDKCVGCGLEWGVDHDGSLGPGYKRLGAFVWQCTDCGAVQNIPDPGHRRVAWR